MTDAARQDIQPFLAAELDKAFSTPEDQRTRVQQLTLSRHATLEHWNQKLNELPPSSQVYAATSFFNSAGNFKPSLGPREVRKLVRGDIQSPREIMLPGALSQLKDIPWNPGERELSQESERRLTLAEWISHPRNGLFWRTMANRIWQHHFGSPLAGTPNDLGHSGQAPTHPELLDWLACELRDSNGSLKHLHRLILNTASTYQQSATFRDAAAKIDASNQYYWRMSPRRLDAESFRDTLLALSQDLATEMGGPSVQTIQHASRHSCDAHCRLQRLCPWRVRDDTAQYLSLFVSAPFQIHSCKQWIVRMHPAGPQNGPYPWDHCRHWHS